MLAGLAAALVTGLVRAAESDHDKQPVVQTLPEFLDGVSDNALSPDRKQIYRVDGKRRYVTLGRGWTAMLDEQAAVRLGSAGSGPTTAGPPGRALAVLKNSDTVRTRIYVQDDSTGRETGAAVSWGFQPDWALRTQIYRLRDNSTGIMRNEAEAALRYGPRDLWVEGMLRHAGLEDDYSSQPWVDRQPNATFAGARAFWQPLPKLSLSAQAQKAISPDMLPGDERLARSRVEMGAEYQPEVSGLLEGLRLYWREATQLGLLSSQGVDERTTYRRVVGASVPDGSPEGIVYTEVRNHSLMSDDDSLWVIGWRHTLQPAPRWRVNTVLETAEPLGGKTAVRSNTVGLSVSQSAHPSHSLLVETEAVHSSLQNSAYGAIKYTDRFTENSLTAWRLSVTDTRPKQFTGAIGTTNLKASVGWGWREPEDKRFVTMWRYSLLARNAQGANVTIPDIADRRAHIVFGQAGYDLSRRTDVVLRASQRWDRDESFQGGELRRTQLWVARSSRDLNERWVVSGHAATVSDSAGPRRSGVGAELGYNLSRKVAVAVGYNLRGFDEHELELDDQLKKGLVVRLRFAIDPAISRWLDAPMPGRERVSQAVPIDGP
jgi:hypothetical protein